MSPLPALAVATDSLRDGASVLTGSWRVSGLAWSLHESRKYQTQRRVAGSGSRDLLAASFCHSMLPTNPPAAFHAVQASEKSRAAELFGGVETKSVLWLHRRREPVWCKAFAKRKFESRSPSRRRFHDPPTTSNGGPAPQLMAKPSPAWIVGLLDHRTNKPSWMRALGSFRVCATAFNVGVG